MNTKPGTEVTPPPPRQHGWPLKPVLKPKKKKRGGGKVIWLLKYRAALRGLRNKPVGGEAPNLNQLSVP